jgi:uncharacterized oligopeptide transporter (OPT) family protein
MEIDEQLAVLSAAGGDPARLALATVDIAYGHLEATERATVKTALEAAAVPHWVDEAILAVMLGVSGEESSHLLARLRGLRLVEPFPARGPGAINLHQASRQAVRRMLRREQFTRFTQLSVRARRASQIGSGTARRIEALYHLFALDEESAVIEWETLDCETVDPQTREAIAAVLGELQADGLRSAAGKAVALLAIGFARVARKEHVDLEQLASLGHEAFELADESGRESLMGFARHLEGAALTRGGRIQEGVAAYQFSIRTFQSLSDRQPNVHLWARALARVRAVRAEFPTARREFTLRSALTAMVAAAVAGAACPYVTLKLGFGWSMAMVAALAGLLTLGIRRVPFTCWEDNVVQAAAASAWQTASMCVVLAAFDLLRQLPAGRLAVTPTPLQSFLWLTAGSIAGLFLMALRVPARRKDEWWDEIPSWKFDVLDSRRRPLRGALVFATSIVVSGSLFFLELPRGGSHVPGVVFASLGGITAASSGAGLAVSLLAIGSGIFAGMRFATGIFIGAILSSVIAPRVLSAAGIIASPARADLLRWLMWPAVSMLFCAGLVGLLRHWRSATKLPQAYRTVAAASPDEFPRRWTWIGLALALLATIVIQLEVFAISWWMAISAVALSLPLMVFAVRAREQGFDTVDSSVSVVQAVFTGLTGNVIGPVASSGTIGTIAAQSRGIWSYRNGHMIGSKLRYLTYAQLLAAPIGAAVLSWTYPVLRDAYGVGASPGALASPVSQQIAAVAELLSPGGTALGSYALEAALFFGAVCVWMIFSNQLLWRFIPSPVGIAIGMLLPGSLGFTIFLGAIIDAIWTKIDRDRSRELFMPLVTGLIAGEALVAVLVPLVDAFLA